MAIKTIKEESLTALGNAIRNKTGNENLLEFPNGMVNAISGIETSGAIEALDITANGVYNAPEGVDGYNPITVNVPQDGSPPEEAFIISGNCDSRFSDNNWNWFVEGYGNKITTENIRNCSRMFNNSDNLTSIPFNINCDKNNNISFLQIFEKCNKLTNIGKIINPSFWAMGTMFYCCYNLRYLPEFVNPNFSCIHTSGNNNGSMFKECYSLRQIPENFLKELWSITDVSSFTFFWNWFSGCSALDEIRGINPQTSDITSNILSSSFSSCSRVKDIIFATQDDGTPYTVNWSNQTCDLSWAVGYLYMYTDNILNYNSGITADKEVIDDTTYQALKNDPDWFTTKVEYSRYNHDSAVNTINSLPDTSAFLATNGGTNTIKFKSAAGSATDGGAINTLTEAEIAVATAKGWTVSLS